MIANPFAAGNVCSGPGYQPDNTEAIETCMRLNPAGNVILPPGTYIVTRPLVKNRNQNLQGSGSKATILKCRTPDMPCIIAADTAGGPNNYNFSEIRSLTIQGSGAAAGGTGVLLGGDPQNKLISKNAYGDGVNFTDVRITGFMRGIEWGNHAWANKILHAAIFENAVGLFVPQGLNDSGEAISVTDSNLFNNSISAIDDQSNFEWFIQGTSFDYNATSIKFLGSTIHVNNCHFEQPRAQVFFEPYGRAVLSIRDSEILIQNTAGSDKYIADLWPQSISLTIDDVTIWSNHPVESFLHLQGELSTSIISINGNGNHKIRSLSNVSVTTGVFTALPFGKEPRE